ncbi:MAG: hypothetical protein KGN16_00185 [Burkholderiales bacterium]|nr:hypothetical protein [Burkholderiales bacterium]
MTELQFAGHAGEAFAYAESVRAAYFTNLKSSAITRNWTAVAATGFTASSLYTAMKPNTGSDGDKRMLVRQGVALASLYGLRQFFVNPNQEAAYVEGYTALTCLMLQSSALLMTESAPNAHVENSDIDKLQRNLKWLEMEIFLVNKEIATGEAIADVLAGADVDIKKSQAPLRKRIAEAKTALSYAQHTLTDGRLLLDAVLHSGQSIEDRVGVIMASVNAKLQGQQHDFGAATDNFKTAHGVVSGILNIGGNTAADQQQLNTGASAGLSGARFRGELVAGPMSAAAGRFLAPGLAAATAIAASAAASGAAGKPPALPASGGKGKATKPPQKAPAAAQAAKSAVPSMKQLESIRDQLDLAIKELTDKQAAADQAASAAALDKQKQAISKEIASLNEVAPYCSASQPLGLQACTVALAKSIERLYELRRPVAQVVLNFRSEVRQALEVPTCQELAPVRVSPNEAKRLYAGESATFVVTQRASGSPFVSLDGPSDKDAGVTLDLAPVGGTSTYLAKVSVGPKMTDYSRAVQLIVTDGTGTSNQIIPIFAGGVAPGHKAASAPDGPASGASAAAAK